MLNNHRPLAKKSLSVRATPNSLFAPTLQPSPTPLSTFLYKQSNIQAIIVSYVILFQLCASSHSVTLFYTLVKILEEEA